MNVFPEELSVFEGVTLPDYS